MKMIFSDYDIQLESNGDIALDESLSLEQLEIKEGQLLKIVLINNKIVLQKIESCIGCEHGT